MEDLLVARTSVAAWPYLGPHEGAEMSLFSDGRDHTTNGPKGQRAKRAVKHLRVGRAPLAHSSFVVMGEFDRFALI
jgi:hypothetical protein